MRRKFRNSARIPVYIALGFISLPMLAACGSAQTDAPVELNSSSTDAEKIANVIELQTQAIESGDEVLYKKTLCLPERSSSDAEEPLSHDLFKGLFLKEVEDVEISEGAATATAVIGYRGEDQESRNTIALILSDSEGWLIC